MRIAGTAAFATVGRYITSSITSNHLILHASTSASMRANRVERTQLAHKPRHKHTQAQAHTTLSTTVKE